MSQFEQERRAQRFAFVGLAAAMVFALVQVGMEGGRVLGFQLPVGSALGVALVGGIVGVVAVMRRAPVISYAAMGLVLAGLALVGDPLVEAGPVTLALGLLFAASALAFVELVHVARRHERAHRVVETEHAPEESLDRVTFETLRTLANRLGLAVLAVGAGVALTHVLALVGPRQWRAAVETTGPLGVALATLTLFGLAALYVLARGSTLREENPQEPAKNEVEIDVAQ